MHPGRSTSKSGQDPFVVLLSRVGIKDNVVRKVQLSLNGAIQSSTTNEPASTDHTPLSCATTWFRVAYWFQVLQVPSS